MKPFMYKAFALIIGIAAISSPAFSEPATQVDQPQNAQYGEVAQTKPKPTAPQAGQPTTAINTSANYSDQELKTFVEAAKEVDQIKGKYEGKLAAAKGQAEIDKIKSEADQELAGAVKEKGLTIEQYNTMHETALKDPKVLARIQQYL